MSRQHTKRRPPIVRGRTYGQQVGARARTSTNGSGTTVFSLDITAAGPGFLPLEKLGTPNTAMIITLAAGGVGISGKVCVGQHWIQ